MRAEFVVTGSYAWWRKRRDLRTFAKLDLPLPIHVSDPDAFAILGERARLLPPGGLNWEDSLRFGVVTDRFTGGFKLKALEYVAQNCVVLSLCDIRADFEGLPHMEEFVRVVRDADEIQSLVAGFAGEDPRAVTARFRVFQAACTTRFAWERCLRPLSPPFEPTMDLDD